MKEKKPKPKRKENGSVRIKNAVIDLVKEDKKKTGVEIGKFFELAAIEKLNKSK